MDIFIVEDDALQSKLLAKALSKIAQTKLCQFSSVDDCIRKMKETSGPILLISDICLPNRTGISLLKELKQYKNIIGLVVVSGVEQALLDSIHFMAEQLGIAQVKFFSKPIVLSHIKITIEQFINAYLEIKMPNRQQSKHFNKKELINALAVDEFEPYFQPQIDTHQNCIRGVEILGRLHRDGNTYFPDVFIENLISNQLITIYTYVILKKAIQYLKQYNLESMIISLNVDYFSLKESDFAKRIIELLASLEFPVKQLIIEVTENKSDLGLEVISNLTELRLAGVMLSIDDFGTGYSGVIELLTLPFSEIKLDKSYVKNSTSSHKLFQMVSGLCSLSNTLELVSVAEGVETLEKARLLHDLGVNFQQGFLYSKAVQASELDAVLKRITVQVTEYNFTNQILGNKKLPNKISNNKEPHSKVISNH